MKIYHVNDVEFSRYGTVLTEPDCKDMLSVMEAVPIPEQVAYVASCQELENCASMEPVRNGVFGGMEVQAGYCHGQNRYLNAVEYHKCSELNVAVTDLILLLGMVQDIPADFTYETNRLEAFFVPKGTVVEVYATTLHYAPCQTLEEGFSWIVILPKGTNTDLNLTEIENLEEVKESKILFARNKWLIAHKEAEISGAFNGLEGKNMIF